MALVDWKDLPDTSTPLNAENLNNNSNEVINLINDELYYKDKEVVTLNIIYYSAGLVTGGGSNVRFSMPLQKKLDNIKSVNVQQCVVDIRKSDGGYIISNDSVFNYGTLTVYISQLTNTLNLDITFNSPIAAINNSPMTVSIRQFTATLNA